MKQQLSIIVILLIISCSAFVPSHISVSIHPHQNSIVALAESKEDLKAGELWKVERVDHISDWSEINASKTYPNPLSLKDNVPSSWFVGINDAVAAKVQVNALETVDDSCVLSDDDDDDEDWDECEPRSGISAEAFILAGPRAEIVFEPKTCKSAIVTCGGLCPGLNSVIREVVMCLRRQYGVTKTLGIPSGYRGFLNPDTWINLDEENVKTLHKRGGSILGSSRGGHDTNAIVDSLVDQGINMLFVVGGDGTVRGAEKISQRTSSRTFGFETAVEEARSAIDVANVEAEGFPHGLGIVKVMGRNSGFIAMNSALSSCVADLVLVPEVDFKLDGPGGIVDHLYERLVEHDKAVVVVAEGAGQRLMKETGAVGEEVKDASGNVLLDDIGPWLSKP